MFEGSQPGFMPALMHSGIPHAYPPPWAYGRQYPSPPNSATYPPPYDPWAVPGPEMPRWTVPYHPPQWTSMMYSPSKSWDPAPRMPPPMGSSATPPGSMAWPRGIVPAQPPPSAKPIQQAPLPTSPRGPPCKPKQSGWAIWVGNLPPSTTVIHLKDYFSQHATGDILSVFLISKTNCAFVNYRSEAACLATIDRVDGAQFRGNRLVCRIRRDQSNSNGGGARHSALQSDLSSLSQSNYSSEGSVNSGNAADDGPLIVQGDQTCARVDLATSRNAVEIPSGALERLSIADKVPARVFILKSLTLQDLLVSTRDGTWVTQAHNEAKLNAAFAAADAVYLVFSVNKSGQYFGYARMEANISGSATEATPAPTVPASNPRGPDVPLSIPTPATATAPAGRVMDDSARGTIFWEAVATAAAPFDTSAPADATDSVEPDRPTSAPAEPGRQFSVRWLSTTPVPFHATRGLRNPLNGNREVKIARDGTEVEARVGGRLLRLFHSREGVQGFG